MQNHGDDEKMHGFQWMEEKKQSTKRLRAVNVLNDPFLMSTFHSTLFKHHRLYSTKSGPRLWCQCRVTSSNECITLVQAVKTGCKIQKTNQSQDPHVR